MQTRHWYIGVALLVAALVFHALVPRYEWRAGPQARLVRIDRWTGRAQPMTLEDMRAGR